MSGSYGEGDPAIPELARRAHEAAERDGRGSYTDPATGYLVQCASALRQRGRCCGLGCRHCPFPREAQRAAGRAILRPLPPGF
ncbi:MAG: hypothetical protein IPN34_23195 [Planctomycetes bacterium]|nr:hypothetical protein [Planctomycetota bacterium]